MSLKEREERRKNSAAKAMLSTNTNDIVSENKPKLTQKSYYIEDDHHKAITLKTAEGELDKSGVVRAALEMYLEDILEQIRKNK